MSVNNDKIIKLADSIETYAYEMRKDVVFKNEEIKCNSIIKQTKTVTFNDITGRN